MSRTADKRAFSFIVAATLSLSPAQAGAQEAAADAAQCLPDTKVAVGVPQTVATHQDFAKLGFAWGPSDGNFGAIPRGGGNYTFYGTGGSAALTPAEGAYTFSGTLDHIQSANTATKLFGPASGPADWVFDRDYAGGGMVVRFDDGQGHAGRLMSFHGEYHWQNLANPPGYLCFVGNTQSQVPCFYSGLGLAVSLDDGATFNVVGQIMQPTQPLSAFVGSGTNMAVGYGSLLVAGQHGHHLPNPPPEPSEAYFYLVYADQLPAGTAGVGPCAGNPCFGLARARYDHVSHAALSGNPDKVAKTFRKYDASRTHPWSQPATSDTADLSGTAGSFSPLWTDEVSPGGSVLYDRDYNVYLAVYQRPDGVHIRASRNLRHWTGTIATIPFPTSPAAIYYYPTLIGETKSPTVGGAMPHVYFSSFPVNGFPNWNLATFQYVPLSLAGTKHGCAP
jgi:hypothetical protein